MGGFSLASEDRARIGLAEEFGIEVALERLRYRTQEGLRSQSGVDHCYILIHGPGGDVHSSYRIASALQNAFHKITVFVPRFTSSGGTLLSLVGDEIVMGEMSLLSPIDDSIPYRDTHISTRSAERAFLRCLEWSRDTPPEHLNYLQRRMIDKIDPFIMEDLEMRAENYRTYADAISGGDNLLDSHVLYGGSPFSWADAQTTMSSRLMLHRDTWNVMRLWLSRYLFGQGSGSYIRYVLPADTEEEEDGTQSQPGIEDEVSDEA